jgi:hypothetical protein
MLSLSKHLAASRYTPRPAPFVARRRSSPVKRQIAQHSVTADFRRPSHKPERITSVTRSPGCHPELVEGSRRFRFPVSALAFFSAAAIFAALALASQPACLTGVMTGTVCDFTPDSRWIKIRPHNPTHNRRWLPRDLVWGFEQ